MILFYVLLERAEYFAPIFRPFGVLLLRRFAFMRIANAINVEHCRVEHIFYERRRRWCLKLVRKMQKKRLNTFLTLFKYKCHTFCILNAFTYHINPANSSYAFDNCRKVIKRLGVSRLLAFNCHLLKKSAYRLELFVDGALRRLFCAACEPNVVLELLEDLFHLFAL